MGHRAVSIVLAGVAVAVAAACASAGRTASSASAACPAALVRYAPYPGRAPGLGRLPWVAGTPSTLGLVGLLWYWPEDWKTRRVEPARIFTGGEVRAGGPSTKILWAFLSPSAKRRYAGGDLVVQGRRLDGPGRTWQRFASIGYAGQKGAPSFASIVTLPVSGCWRLRLSAGGLHAAVVVRAVRG
jgi:hypothetical protein